MPVAEPARLVLIRHGESLANTEQRFTRDAEEPLTALGTRQARETGGFLRAHFAPARLYSSPFRRAFDTATEIGRHFDLEPVVVDDLREQDFGIYRGRPYGDLYGQHPAGSVERWDHLPEGGERLREVAKRAGSVLDQLAEEHVGEEVLVISHGGVMSALRAWVRNDFSSPPVPTRNAWGYVLHGMHAAYEGPFELDELSG